jgi:hypothetical protein
MPETIKLKENHICKRCHKKIYKGEDCVMYDYSDGKQYRHTNLDCKVENPSRQWHLDRADLLHDTAKGFKKRGATKDAEMTMLLSAENKMAASLSRNPTVFSKGDYPDLDKKNVKGYTLRQMINEFGPGFGRQMYYDNYDPYKERLSQKELNRDYRNPLPPKRCDFCDEYARWYCTDVKKLKYDYVCNKHKPYIKYNSGIIHHIIKNPVPMYKSFGGKRYTLAKTAYTLSQYNTTLKDLGSKYSGLKVFIDKTKGMPDMWHFYVDYGSYFTKNPTPEKGMPVVVSGKPMFFAGRTLYPSKADLLKRENKDRGIDTILKRTPSGGTFIYTSQKTYPDLSEPLWNPKSSHKWKRITATDTGETMYNCFRCGDWRIKGEPGNYPCPGTRRKWKNPV